MNTGGTSTQLSSDQLTDLAVAFDTAAGVIRDALTTPDIANRLTPGEFSALSADQTTLGTIATSIATRAALLTFADADDAFQRISDSTQQATDAVTKLLAKIASVTNGITVVGKLISLGVLLTSGTAGLAAIGGAINDLVGAVQKAGNSG